MLITSKNVDVARKELLAAKKKVIIASSDDINRKLLEKYPKAIEALVLNLAERKDKQKQRDTGFNQVIAKLAKKNNVRILINLEELHKEKHPSQILARMSQVIALAKKYHLALGCIHAKEHKDVQALFAVLGASTSMTKELKTLNTNLF